MIVSASYRTDIPAFYGRWFLNRFRAGFARVANPYGGRPSTVPLREGVGGFVFWTRNAAPFLPVLAEIRGAGLPFVVQYTVTGLPRALEAAVTGPDKAADTIRRLAGDYGPHAVVWRFDPILFTSLTPPGWHEAAFATLAESLAGSVDEAVISFANPYRKTVRNLDAAARAHDFAWSDPPAADKRALAGRLATLAAERGMALTLCSQADLIVSGTKPAACIDARRLEAVAADWGLPRLIPARVKGNRPGCRCHESRDIGAYDTCPHGCVYCYAVGSRAAARRRFAAHDPEDAFLGPAPQNPTPFQGDGGPVSKA
jgi:hypothetical protein